MVQEILDLLSLVDNTEDLDVINHALQKHRELQRKQDLLYKMTFK